MKGRILIRQAMRDEWDEAMDLAWRTFLKFEAADYSDKGIDSFREFVTSSVVYRMFIVGSYELFVALIEGRMVGMASLRNVNHISLFFVEKDFQNIGVGRAIFSYLSDYVRDEAGGERITVDSAPYALGFYRRMGFRATSPERTEQGIIYTPMEYIIP